MKKIISKILAIGLVLAMGISVVGCSGGNGNNSSGGGSNNSGNNGTGGGSENVGGGEVSFTNISLASNAKSAYSIVIPSGASDCINNAAQELNRYFAAATGAQLNIIKDDGLSFDANAKYISLGDTTIFEGSGMTVDVDELNRDGYKIKRYGNTVVIGAAKEIGVLYGVYEFLSYQFDFEAYASDEIYYEKKSEAYLADFDVVDAPSFVGRVTDGAMQFDTYGSMLLRFRNNTITSSVYDYGDSKTFAPGHSETFMKICPRINIPMRAIRIIIIPNGFLMRRFKFV